MQLNKIYCGDSLETLKTFPEETVDCCVTSPPFWGLRDYGTGKWNGGNENCSHKRDSKHSESCSTGQRNLEGAIGDGIYRDICKRCGAVRIDRQIGLEKTPEEYTARLLEVFKEVKRVLKKEGTLWLNLGDSYASSGKEGGDIDKDTGMDIERGRGRLNKHPFIKPKDLCGIPWMVAKALQSPFYAGKIAQDVDRVWLSAMIDAEGTICGFTHKRKDNGDIRNGIHITITNSNTAILDKCFDIWPTTREEHNVHSEGHLGDLPTWRWIVHGIEHKSALLRELYPFFVGKKKQALLAWNFLEISRTTRGRNKGDEGIVNRDKYTWIIGALSKLNHLEQVDIPSWIKEPSNLYSDGWYLRSDIIWHKPNPMPESVTDRPTKSHEYVFLLSKSPNYFYDAEAIMEEAAYDGRKDEIMKGSEKYKNSGQSMAERGHHRWTKNDDGLRVRNKRSVWTIPTHPYPDAHFATFPEALVLPMIKAGCPVGGTVLEPFCGSGTTCLVAKKLNRNYIGIDLNPEYVRMAERRIELECGTLI